MYNQLKAKIDQYIRTNGVRAITGAILNEVLNDMVDGLGTNAGFGGSITPSSEAPTTDSNIFFIASTAGTYTNFSGIVVASGELAFIHRQGNGWAKDSWTISVPDISGKADKVSNATSGNFAGLDANGNVKDSGCDEGTFIKGVQKNGTDLTPDANGKVNVEVQDDVQTFATGEEVNETPIDDTHLDNPVAGSLAKADDVMQLKNALDNIGAEKYIPEYTVVNGYKVLADGTITSSSTFKITTIPIVGFSSVSFMGRKVYNGSTDGKNTGYCFGHYNGEETEENWVIDKAFFFYRKTETGNVSMEYSVDIDNILLDYPNVTHLRLNCQYSNFFCYLFKGKRVVEQINEIKEELIVNKEVQLTLDTISPGLRPQSGTGELRKYPDDFTYCVWVKKGMNLTINYNIPDNDLRAGFCEIYPIYLAPFIGYQSKGSSYTKLNLIAPEDSWLVFSFNSSTAPTNLSVTYSIGDTIGHQLYSLDKEVENIENTRTSSSIMHFDNEQITVSDETGKYISTTTLNVTETDNPMHLTSQIQLSKGSIISFYGSTLNTVPSAICITSSDGTPIKSVVKGLANNAKGYFSYLAEEDCYVRLSFYNTATIWKINHPIFSDILDKVTGNSFPLLSYGIDGDSVTEGSQWSSYMIQKLGGVQRNVAVGGACWSYKSKRNKADTADITPQSYNDPNFAGFGGSSPLTNDTDIQKFVNNNACTHIEKYLSLVNAGTADVPDVFIFAMGTNADTGNGNSNGTVDQAMSAASLSDIDFVDGNGKSLKYTMCGAMRWCIQTIKENFPNCVVFVSLPIQRASWQRNKEVLADKLPLIREMATQMGCQIIDQYSGCGITSAIELDSSPYGPYLRDGLHPNEDGQELMGKYAAQQIKTLYFS